MIDEQAPPEPVHPPPPPRLIVRDDLVAVWRAACAVHELAWRCWVAGAGGAAPVLAALDREESAARALARFCRAGL